MGKRVPTATESLLKVALGIDIVLIFFGTLVIRGLGRFDEGVVWSVGGVLFVLVVLLFRLIRYRFGQWIGHVVHVGMLAGFAIDLAVGLSVAVAAGFWAFGAIRGAQLDRLGPPPVNPQDT
jgi:accessory gene regulator protein AgrB